MKYRRKDKGNETFALCHILLVRGPVHSKKGDYTKLWPVWSGNHGGHPSVFPPYMVISLLKFLESNYHGHLDRTGGPCIGWLLPNSQQPQNLSNIEQYIFIARACGISSASARRSCWSWLGSLTHQADNWGNSTATQLFSAIKGKHVLETAEVKVEGQAQLHTCFLSPCLCHVSWHAIGQASPWVSAVRMREPTRLHGKGSGYRKE